MKANRQIRNMKFETQASENYRQEIEVINSNTYMSAAEKRAAKEAAAEAFLASGMGTKRGIREKFEEYQQAAGENYIPYWELPESIRRQLPGGEEALMWSPGDIMRRATGKDEKKMARYMEAGENMKRDMEARNSVGSEAIQQLAEAQTAGLISTMDLYEMMGELAIYDEAGFIKSADDLSTIIAEMIELRNSAEW